MRMRISNEDGINAGVRNWGRLALMTIPLALGLGGSAWLGFYIGVHDFRRELSQEERAAIVVGAEQRPTSKIKITIKYPYCAPVTRADLDGAVLRLYATNNCQKELKGMDWHYESLSPNGTVLYDGYMNQIGGSGCPTPRLPGDKSECVFAGRYGGYIDMDDRVAEMRVWTVPYSKP